MLFRSQDTILSIEFDKEFTQNNVHVEYELITQDKASGFLSSNLYLKLIDSFSGVNTVGLSVPDKNLPAAEQYGVDFRPRQNMFVNRYAALENYITYVNSILKLYPISEIRNFRLLNSSEPEPTIASGEWDKRLDNIEQLSYQNLYIVPIGYKYLVASDSTNQGLWTIYTVLETGLAKRYTQLTRVQNYDTKKYWIYIDWYEIGYNSSTVPSAQVAIYSDLASIATTTEVGAYVKVDANAQNNWEIYQRTATGWNRVGLQDGTIALSDLLWNYKLGNFGFDVEVFDAQYFDQEPVIETRKIIQAINEELFVDELAIERNRSLILMFEYVYSEFTSPNWLIKTSLIDVDHKIRALLPFQKIGRAHV